MGSHFFRFVETNKSAAMQLVIVTKEADSYFKHLRLRSHLSRIAETCADICFLKRSLNLCLRWYKVHRVSSIIRTTVLPCRIPPIPR